MWTVFQTTTHQCGQYVSQNPQHHRGRRNLVDTNALGTACFFLIPLFASKTLVLTLLEFPAGRQTPRSTYRVVPFNAHCRPKPAILQAQGQTYTGNAGYTTNSNRNSNSNGTTVIVIVRVLEIAYRLPTAQKHCCCSFAASCMSKIREVQKPSVTRPPKTELEVGLYHKPRNMKPGSIWKRLRLCSSMADAQSVHG